MTEETFDPRTPAEWATFGALAHRMVDDMLASLTTLSEQPVWRVMPAAVRDAINAPIPRVGIGAERAYGEFMRDVAPYTLGNRHPRFFGWVQGNGTALGMMADMLAAGLNPHMAGFNQAPARVEQQVVDWLADLLGMRGASGVLVTGGTMASTLALSVARFAMSRAAGVDVREEGVQAWPGCAVRSPLVFYGSSETHAWAQKAAEFMGLGGRAFRRVPVDSEYRIDVRVLEELIERDRRDGATPFCVIGTAGTVNTGATDDLTAVATVARRERLWFHVDGAFGSLAYLSRTLRPLVAGIEHADSLAFDLHKWGSLPFECGCVLVRDPVVHRAAFATQASYLAETTRGVMAGGLPFADRGLDLTRGFKALKIWMSLKADGVDKLVRMIEQNVEQTRYLIDRIAEHSTLELLAPAPLNIACFRYVPANASDGMSNAVNTEILLRLQEDGIAVPSSTMLHGRFAIRVANVNHRTRRTDLDLLIDSVVRLGREIEGRIATSDGATR